MDPVSTLAIVNSCLAIAGKSISALKAISRTYTSYRKAPECIALLNSDVKKAELILLAIQEQVSTSEILLFPSLHERVRDVFTICARELENVQLFAEKHNQASLSSGGYLARLMKLKFTWNATEIESHRTELERQIGYLRMIRDEVFNSQSTTKAQQEYLKTLNSILRSRPNENAVGTGRIGPSDAIWPDNQSEQTARTTGTSIRSIFGIRHWSRRFSRQLVDAAKEGDVVGINDCLQHHADVNYQSTKTPPKKKGMAAIHAAAEYGHLNAIEALVGKGADLKLIIYKTKETALHLAARNGYSEVVRYLVRSGAPLNARDRYGQTALIKAHMDENIQKILLEAGADPNIPGIDANTALHYAAHFGSVRTVRRLVESGGDVNACNKLEQSPLWLACSNSKVVEEKRMEIVTTLLEASASIDLKSKVKGMTSFHVAVLHNDPIVVQTLLSQGADIGCPTAEGLYPLHLAAQLESGLILSKLCPLYRNIDVRDTGEGGYTALHLAVRNNNKPCVDVLLSAKASLITASKDGFKALHHAFRSGSKSTSVAETLINEHVRRKIPITQLDALGSTFPIQWASTPKLAALWVQSKGPMNMVNNRGWSVLHFAALFQDSHTLEILIKFGANARQVDKNGRTPIELLCDREDVWILKSGRISPQRLEVLQFLLKNTSFTPKCREAIEGWKNEGARTMLSKHLPWRSLSEMAAMSWNVLPAVGITAAGIFWGLSRRM